FAVALVLWAAERAFGGEAGYAGVLAVWGHANLANIAGAILLVAVALATPASSLPVTALDRLLKSNAGAFLPEGTALPVVTFASSFDASSPPPLPLLVRGFRRIKGMPPAAATALPVALWLVYVCGKTGLAFLRA